MGNLRLTIQAGKVSREINLTTLNDDASKDEPILAALKQVAAIKDEGHAGELSELSAKHKSELDAIAAEMLQLREPIIARVVLARTRLKLSADPKSDADFYAGMPTARLLQEDKHYNGASDGLPESSLTVGDAPAEIPKPPSPDTDHF